VSAADVSPMGERLLGFLPPYFHTDPAVVALVDALARELERLEAAAARLRDAGFFPHRLTADGYLRLWESIYGLPVAPEGASEASRRNTLLAVIRGRKAASGAGWVEAVETLLGGQVAWEYQEHVPDPNRLTITMPYTPAGYSAGQVEALARAITPAHVDIIVAYEEGFLIDISEADREPV
jgi:uncharacterized protein YmfQ (DUF2313 family)